MFGGRRFPGTLAFAVTLLGVIVLAGCQSPADRAKAYYEHGVELVEAGEPTKAGLEFRNALKIRGDFIEALFALGNVEEKLGHFDNAVGAYVSVTEQSPENVPSRVRLAYILVAADKQDLASKYAEQALAISPDDTGALTVKAAIELKNDNRGEAVRLAQLALQQDPAFIDASIVLASERMLASDPAGALKYLEIHDDSSERNIGLQALRLSALDALGDQPGVEQLFEKLILLFPENPAFQQSLVQWYLDKGRKDDAERVLRQHAADHAKDDNAQLSLVAYLNGEKGPVAAITELDRQIDARVKSGGDAFGLRMALAQLEFAAGDKDASIELLKTVASSADNANSRNQARIHLASVLIESSDLLQARQMIEAVLAEDAKNTDALMVRAAIFLSSGKIDDAIADLLNGLNEAPTNVRLNALLAQAYEKNGNTALAEEQYTKALTLDANSPATGLPMVQFLMRYGKIDQARRVLEAVHTNVPGNPQVLTLLGQLRLATQDWVGAQEIAEALRKIEASAADPTADKIAAAALGGMKRYADSIKLLQTSIDNGADQKAVLADLVQAYVLAGRQPAAEAFLRSVVEKDPSDVQAQVLLASVYLTMDRKQDAESVFKTAASMDASAVGDTALAQFYLNDGRDNEAETAARAGLERDAESVPLRLLLAAVLERQQRFDEAIAEYAKMYKTDPDSTIVANDLASLLSERRASPEALNEAFEIAQRFKNSEIPQYLDTLGWIYYLRGDYPAALPLLKSAAQKLPTMALVQYHLGMVLTELGQNDLAGATLQNAISMSPPLIESDLEKAHTALGRLNTPATITR